MAVGNHTDDWFRAKNAATGQPPGARHSDKWYADEIARRQAAAAAPKPEPPPAVTRPFLPGEGWVNPIKPDHPSVGAPMPPAPPPPAPPPPPPPPPPPVVPPGPTADEIAAADQAKLAARRDGWDKANNQGIHDADGWQSIGYQPDYIGMPSWWDGPGASTPPPAAPPVAPPASPLDANPYVPGSQTSGPFIPAPSMPSAPSSKGEAPPAVIPPPVTPPAAGPLPPGVAEAPRGMVQCRPHTTIPKRDGGPRLPRARCLLG